MRNDSCKGKMQRHVDGLEGIRGATLGRRRHSDLSLMVSCGKQSFSNGKPNAAIGWQCLAVLIILIRSGVEGEWLGLAFGIAVLNVEVLSIRRISKTQEAKSSE